MANLDNDKLPNRPIYDRSTNPNVRPPASYQDGYADARRTEQRVYATEQQRESDTANGFMFGLILAGVGLLTAGAVYYLSQQDRVPNAGSQVAPVTAPSVAPSQSPQVRERVIERDRVVPVPQQAPNVNITVPGSPTQQNPVVPPQESPTQPEAPTNQNGNAPAQPVTPSRPGN